MGQAAVGAGDHNGVEGHLIRAKAQHVVLESGGDFPLGHAGADKPDDL